MRKRGRPRKVKPSVRIAAKVGRIDVKLSPAEVARAEALVREGVFMTKADFARTAIREKLSQLRVAEAALPGARVTEGDIRLPRQQAVLAHLTGSAASAIRSGSWADVPLAEQLYSFQ